MTTTPQDYLEAPTQDDLEAPTALAPAAEKGTEIAAEEEEPPTSTLEAQPSAMDLAIDAPALDPLGELEDAETITTTEEFWKYGGSAPASGGGGMMPVQGNITSPFGSLTNRGVSGNPHNGMDIGVPEGTPVRAPTSGVIEYSKWAGAYGNAVYIKADDGTYHLLAHLSRSNVQRGQRVQAGQVVALSGNTGRSFGPHLHWEVRSGDSYGSAYNPQQWLRSAPQATSSGGGGQYNGNLASLAQQAGFTPSQARIMAAIAMAESSGNPRAHNPNWRTGDDSYGLWQINMLGDMGPSRRRAFGISNNTQLFDPLVNARAAKTIFDWQGFNAWTVYKTGAYRRYL